MLRNFSNPKGAEATPLAPLEPPKKRVAKPPEVLKAQPEPAHPEQAEQITVVPAQEELLPAEQMPPEQPAEAQALRVKVPQEQPEKPDLAAWLILPGEP